MAATEALRHNRTSARPATRTRLPLTPKVTTNRRGGHDVARRAQPVESPAAATVTPAMHITPNVVSAARGGMALNSRTRLTDASKSRALDMRGLRL